MVKHFSVVEFSGDKIIITPVDTCKEGVKLFCQKFYTDTLLDEFIIINEYIGDVVFIGSKAFDNLL